MTPPELLVTGNFHGKTEALEGAEQKLSASYRICPIVMDNFCWLLVFFIG
jgi:hypothetical protein